MFTANCRACKGCYEALLLPDVQAGRISVVGVYSGFTNGLNIGVALNTETFFFFFGWPIWLQYVHDVHVTDLSFREGCSSSSPDVEFVRRGA